MTDTLESTFSTFFSSEPEPTKCLDCGSTENLTILYTTEETGDAVRVCKTCKARRDTESIDRAAKSKARIDEWAWRDAWEEE